MGLDKTIDITAKQRATILALLERHLPNTEAWAYGSRVKWTSRPQSDLDLVVLAKPQQWRQVNALREAFEESNLPFRVDLFVWDKVPEAFRAQIDLDHAVLVADPRTCAPSASSASSKVPRVMLSRVIDLRLSSVDKKTNVNEHPISLCNYTDVYHNSFIHGDLDFMDGTATAREIARCTLRVGDVIITKDSERHDDIGVPALVRETVPDLVCGYHLAILRPRPSRIDGTYMFYALSTADAQQQFHSYANGVTRFGLRKADIGLVDIPLPPLRKQRAIAHVLRTLDDKIELNRRMNATLEATARALFRSWFVDFDPVRAKMEGRDTGLPKDIADLFPDRLVDSELGKIPNGWRVGVLGDIADSSRKGVDPASVAIDTPYIGLEHMPRRSIALVEWGETGSVSSNKTAFANADILFGKLRPYFHKVGIAPVNGVCSTDIVVVKARMSRWSAFVLACMSSSRFVGYTSQTSTGTRMPRTSWHTMSGYELCRPNDASATTFQRVVSPMLERIVANVHESRVLGFLRDALLPGLVSGELRVPALDACSERQADG